METHNPALSAIDAELRVAEFLDRYGSTLNNLGVGGICTPSAGLRISVQECDEGTALVVSKRNGPTTWLTPGNTNRTLLQQMIFEFQQL